MNHTPYREQHIHAEHCKIVDTYLTAACSGPTLESVHLAMTAFRVCNRRDARPDLYYRTGAILRELNTLSLVHVAMTSVEVSGYDLEFMIGRLPSFKLKGIALRGVHLHEGRFANFIEALKSIKTDSTECDIDLFDLTGGEFGPPPERNEDPFSFDLLGNDGFWERLEDRLNPPLLRLTTSYVRGESQTNPLLTQSAALSQR